MAYIAIRGGRVLDASEVVHPQVGRCASAASVARTKFLGRVDGEDEGDGNAGGTGRDFGDGRDLATWVMMTLVASLSPKSCDQLRIDEAFGRRSLRRRGSR